MKLTQTELSKKTGIGQSHISEYLKQIREGKIITPNIEKILIAQGHGDAVREFKRVVNNN